MSNPWSEIAAHNRHTEALAERWELRIHALLWVLTAVVLIMRLVAGRQDLTSDGGSWHDPSAEEPGIEAASVVIH
jgi:hypothetical protein